jgi:hypothetical protein
LLSVTVTVNGAVGSVADGVPEMTPVLELKLSPAGSPGEILYVSGAVPPLPLTGMNGVAA